MDRHNLSVVFEARSTYTPPSWRWPPALRILPSMFGIQGFDSRMKLCFPLGGVDSLVPQDFTSRNTVFVSFQPVGRGPSKMS